jgi:xanthine dehydrogenase accessory factor
MNKGSFERGGSVAGLALYGDLLRALDDGLSVVIASRYLANGGVEKSLITKDMPEQWAVVQALGAQDGAASEGPVTSLLAADGTLTVLERYNKRPRLLIIGGGHVGMALSRIGALADFEVVVFDDRPAFANSVRFSEADDVICDSFERLFERLSVRATDFAVVVTRGHTHDIECLEGLLRGVEPAYTGMIGSKRRVAIVMQQLRELGFDPARIERIHSPIGLKIGAVTPFEIAVSIMAEMISVKRIDRCGIETMSCEMEVPIALGGEADNDGGGRDGDGRDSGGRHFDAIVTVYSTDGSSPVEAGAKLALAYDGTLAGTIGGGCAEAEAIRVARELIAGVGADWRAHTIDLSGDAEDEGMVCGGQMQVVIERIMRD